MRKCLSVLLVAICFMAGSVSALANPDEGTQLTQAEIKKSATAHKKAQVEKAKPAPAVAEKRPAPKEDSIWSRGLTIGLWAVGILAVMLVLGSLAHILGWALWLGLVIGALGYLIKGEFSSWGYWGAILGIPAGIIHFLVSGRQRTSSGNYAPADEPMVINPASGVAINPASGMPMVGGSTAGVDMAGNTYGTNNTFHH